MGFRPQLQTQLQHTLFPLRMRIPLLIFCLVFVSVTTQQRPDTVCIKCMRYCARDPSSNACKYCVKMGCQPSGFGPGIGVSCGALITRPNVASLSKTDFFELSKTLGEVKREKNSTGFESIARYHGKPYFCNKDQTGPPSPPLNENGC